MEDGNHLAKYAFGIYFDNLIKTKNYINLNLLLVQLK